MKRLLFLPLLLLATVCAARADITITQKIEGMPMGGGDTTTKIKGGKMRVDTAMGMSIIINGASGEVTNVMHGQKSYMKIPASMLSAAVSNMAGKQAGAAAKPKLTPTGKKEKINNYACEEYTTEMLGQKINMWLTTDVPNYKALLKEMSDSMKGPLSAATQGMNVYSEDLPGFPIRTSAEAAPGQLITSTVTVVETKPVAEADFAVPSGYTEMSMPQLTPPAAAGTPSTKPTTK